MVSFDVKSLYNINITIKRIYKKYETTTVFMKNKTKKLLKICTKNVDFSFSNDIYIQIDTVPLGSPLVTGPCNNQHIYGRTEKCVST